MMASRALVVCLLLAAAACGDSTQNPDSVPASVTVVGGDIQSGTVGQPLGEALVVRVTNARGAGLAAVTVTWTVTAGAGSVSHASSRTDADGEASVMWTVGTSAGAGVNALTATVGALPGVTFTATGTAGPPAALAAPSGGGQTAPAGTVLSSPLGVRVVDSHGNGVAGVTVQWSIARGGGSLSAPSSVSGPDGSATMQWTLGRFAGPHAVTATLPQPSGASLELTAQATPNGTISGTIGLATTLFSTARTGGLASPARTQSAPGIELHSMPRRTAKTRPGVSATPRDPLATHGRRGAPRSVADELIVTFRADAIDGLQAGALTRANASRVNSVAGAMRSRFAAHERAGGLRVLGASPLVRAARVRVTDPAALDGVAAALRREPGVAGVERNGVMWSRHVAPAPALIPRRIPRPAGTPAAMRGALRRMLANDRLYPFQAWHYTMVDLPRAWDITRGSASVVVAVVDDGTRFDHPDLAANLTSDGYDFVSNDEVPLCGGASFGIAGDGNGPDADPTTPVPRDVDFENGCVLGELPFGGHGLHVAGTIGAVGGDGAGVTGVNWTVRVRPVRVMNVAGFGTFYDIAQGLLYAAGLAADNGAGGMIQAPSRAPIINMSLGGNTDSDVMHGAIIQATAAGSLIIATEANDAASTPSFPSSYQEVVAVSAVGPDGNLASYSSFGPTVDIAAPGGDFADGECTFGVISTWWDFASGRPTYECHQGTSMAAPHVAGVAALILAQSPGLSVAELRARLLSFAADRGPPGRDDQYGAGIVDARNSLTRTLAPPRRVFAQLHDAATGRMIRRVAAQPNGGYAFTALPDGDYHVFAGEDENDDAVVGMPGRRWGALGGAAFPTRVTVSGSGDYPSSFPIGLPLEVEDNGSAASANVLTVGGYLFGVIANPDTDADVARIVISEGGTYTFETSAAAGACGFALDEDTILGLFDAAGSPISVNDDIDADRLSFCSRATATLGAGTYYVQVVGYWGGRYRLHARAGF
jgi:subtilisin family serine protease